MITKLLRSLSSSLLLISLLCVSAHATSYSELVRDNQVDEGFVSILRDAKSDKVYLKIDNLNQQFIYQSSLPSGLGSNDIGLDRGQLGATRLVKFERVGNKVLLKQIPDYYRAVSDNPQEAAAIEEAFAASVLWGFAVVDSARDWVLVDASDFVLQDIHAVGRRLAMQKQGTAYSVDASRSALDLERTKAFPDNTELQATITLLGKEPGDYVKATTPDPYAITLKMRHSFVRLPAEGFQSRMYMPKSGYWTMEYRDYAQPINQPVRQKVIGRHRLQKQNPQAPQSEAVEPIVYYLDPGVPEPVRGALLDGARWWNEAFTAIGYQNAFQVKMLPADADPMDVRYNVIQWVHRATRGWSYGSSVIDPRTGEIIKGHVTLGSLRVRQDYLIAQGMLAPFTEKGANDSALMELALARIRQLSAHEVGHTLGIAHNFAASNYGRESVMDYPHPRFELDPQNAQKIIAPNAYDAGLGAWDMAAIEYGYGDFDGDQQVALSAIIDRSDAQGLLYISDADARSPGSAHADASLWDNGADAVSELQRKIALRRVAIENFGAANLKHGRNWSDLEEIFVPVYYSTRYQAQAAAKWLGGLRYEYAVKGQGASTPKLDVVSGAEQQRALQVLAETLQPEYLALPARLRSLLQPKPAGFQRSRESVNGHTGAVLDRITLAAAAAQHTLGLIFHPQRINRISQQSAADASIGSVLSIGRYLHQQVLSGQRSGEHALLQQTVIDLLVSNYLNLLQSDEVHAQVKSEVLALLQLSKAQLRKGLKRSKSDSAYHGFFAYQLARIKRHQEGASSDSIKLPEMPPGSPI